MRRVRKWALGFYYVTTGLLAFFALLAGFTDAPAGEDPPDPGFYAAFIVLCVTSIGILETLRSSESLRRRLVGAGVGVGVTASAYLWMADEAQISPHELSLLVGAALVWLVVATIVIGFFFLLLAAFLVSRMQGDQANENALKVFDEALGSSTGDEGIDSCNRPTPDLNLRNHNKFKVGVNIALIWSLALAAFSKGWLLLPTTLGETLAILGMWATFGAISGQSRRPRTPLLRHLKNRKVTLLSMLGLFLTFGVIYVVQGNEGQGIADYRELLGFLALAFIGIILGFAVGSNQGIR